MRGGDAGERRMVLPLLDANGARASVEGAAWEPGGQEREVRLWYVSLVGAREAVKALWAHLMVGGVARLSEEAFGPPLYGRLAPGEPGSWSWRAAPLPRSAAWHGLLLPSLADHRGDALPFLLLVPEGGDAEALLYRYLERRVDVPLLPHWAGWLFARAEARGELEPLPGCGPRAAYLCRTDPHALRADVSVGVRGGELAGQPGDAGALDAAA